MEQSTNLKKKTVAWYTFERLGVIIALLASLATVVGLFIQIRSDKKLLVVDVLSVDQLTKLPSVSGLDGSFTFNEEQVVDLWRLRLRFTNNGNITLIGQGLSSSLLENFIEVSFPSDIEIVDIEPAIGSFYSINYSSPSTFQLKFSQFRQGENLEIIVFIKSENVLKEKPMPFVVGRPILDGEIEINDATKSISVQPIPAIDYLPPSVSLVGKILGGIIAIVIGVVSFGWLNISSPIGYFRALLWKLRYQELFRNHLDKLDLSEKDKIKYLKKPWSISEPYLLAPDLRISTAINQADESSSNPPSKEDILIEKPRIVIRGLSDAMNIWKDFSGPKPPNPSFDSLFSTLIGFLVGLILTAASAAILASMLKI